jgi:SAM-dependent methyltransferase
MMAAGHDGRMTQTWSPSDYARHAGFVPALGAPLLDRLEPLSGRRVLDLGCGDGALTRDMAARGAHVVAVDASPAMVAAARDRGVDARLGDACQLTFEPEFDVVFSNAVLHWVRDADAALAGIARALVPGGRFVAEFGGHGNIAAIAVGVRAALARRGHQVEWPWYFPTAEEYAARCEAHGLCIHDIALIPRPTLLPTDMAGWLQTFGGPLTGDLRPEDRLAAESEIVELLRPSLCDAAGRWTADYVRLRVEASKLET